MDVLALVVPNRHGSEASAWSDDSFILGACRDPLTAEASPELGELDLRRLLAAMRDETPKPYWIEISMPGPEDLRYFGVHRSAGRPFGRRTKISPSSNSRASTKIL